MFLKRILAFFSRIGFRLLAFNVLLVVLPLAGFLFLDIYEKQLLAMQEDSMIQQGRLIAIALADSGELKAERCITLLKRLKGQTFARLRVVNREGKLLADSSVLFAQTTDPKSQAVPQATESQDSPLKNKTKGESSDWLYSLISNLIKFFRELTGAPRSDLETADFYTKDKPLLGPEIKAALEGLYRPATRLSIGEQRRSIILYCAIPIYNFKEIVGAVLVSQSTYRILVDLYDVRMATLRIFLWCLLLAIFLSLFLSRTIALPLRRLRDEAEAVLDKRGRLMRPFKPSHRLDEIGDLSRSLTLLTARLEKHISFIEGFATDLSHEFKNPLASIRSAAELAASTNSEDEQKRFLKMICEDVSRMERLLIGARDITRLDAELAQEPTELVALDALLEHILAGAGVREKRLRFSFERPPKNVWVQGRPERLAQVFENIIDNAISFSPPGGEIKVKLTMTTKEAIVTIEDQGPGVPLEHRERIFERFFSYRPQGSHATFHSGLGLSIAKIIVEGYGGRILVKDAPQGGALFEVYLVRIEK